MKELLGRTLTLMLLAVFLFPGRSSAQCEYLTDGDSGIGAGFGYISQVSDGSQRNTSATAVSVVASGNDRMDARFTLVKTNGANREMVVGVDFHFPSKDRRSSAGASIGASMVPNLDVFSANMAVYSRNVISGGDRSVIVPFAGVSMAAVKQRYQSARDLEFSLTGGIGIGLAVDSKTYVTFEGALLHQANEPLFIGVSLGLLFYGNSKSLNTERLEDEF